VTTPHTMITCKTAVGAGDGLSWSIQIAEQSSVSPTTDYHIPEILGFDGPGSVDASTDGGEEIVIRGQ